MELASFTERTSIVDPSGQRSDQIVEHRVDPLLGTVASVNRILGEKAKAFLGAADVELLRDIQEKSRATCPFCSAGEKGTRYPPDFVAEGQLRVGAALAIPNLYSKCLSDSVVIVDPSRHVLFPSAIAEPSLADAFRAAAELVRRVRARDPAAVHHVAGMNFLQPSGSSVPHPHLQVHVRTVPYSGIERVVRASEAWHARTGRSFWETLVERERSDGARHVGRTGRVEWLAAWAPARQKEIWGVLPGVADLAAITDADAAAFAAGLARIVSFYEESGSHSFTFAFHSSADPSAARHFALHVRACARPAFRPVYLNYDTWFGPLFAGDDAHVEVPEAYAARLRARF